MKNRELNIIVFILQIMYILVCVYSLYTGNVTFKDFAVMLLVILFAFYSFRMIVNSSPSDKC